MCLSHCQSRLEPGVSGSCHFDWPRFHYINWPAVKMCVQVVLWSEYTHLRKYTTLSDLDLEDCSAVLTTCWLWLRKFLFRPHALHQTDREHIQYKTCKLLIKHRNQTPNLQFLLRHHSWTSFLPSPHLLPVHQPSSQCVSPAYGPLGGWTMCPHLTTSCCFHRPAPPSLAVLAVAAAAPLWPSLAWTVSSAPPLPS